VVTDNGKQQLIDLLCKHGAGAAVAGTACVKTFQTADRFNASFELFYYTCNWFKTTERTWNLFRITRQSGAEFDF
jgi:hypothetical protein